MNARRIAILLLLTALVGADQASADACAPTLQGVSNPSLAGTLSIYGMDNGRSVSNLAMNQAANAWNNKCAVNENPDFLVNQGGGTVFRVHFMSGTDSDNDRDDEGECGGADISLSGGRVVGGDIYLYSEEGHSGGSCNDAANLTHELGHALGLGDSNCSGRIMGNRDATIRPQDCNAVDPNFLTPEERDPPDPPGGGCFRVPPDTETTVLAIGAAAPARLAADGVPLSTTETVDGITYLMEAWAVLALGGGDGEPVAVMRSSGHDFARRKAVQLGHDPAAPLKTVARPAAGDGFALVVETPVHAHNARYIPLPEVSLTATPVSYLGPPVTALVRLDLGEDRLIRDTQLLHATAPLPGGIDVLGQLRAHLDVRYASDKNHRVIVFLTVDLRDGQLTIREPLVTRPLCCCTPICV